MKSTQLTKHKPIKIQKNWQIQYLLIDVTNTKKQAHTKHSIIKSYILLEIDRSVIKIDVWQKRN